MKHLDNMKDFLYRIRLAWAVFRGDYGWVTKQEIGLQRKIVTSYIFGKFHNIGDRDARMATMHKVIDYGLPFIAIWKDYDSCYISYSGTEKELDELKNQEIIID